MTEDGLTMPFQQVADRVRRAEVFVDVIAEADGVRCKARHVESDATYRATINATDPTRVYVGLYTSDRWLSESIEADLMFKGDKMEDLLEEELVDQGYETRLAVEHFRDDGKQFVFRSVIGPLGEEALTDRMTQTLLAYEACFRELGDMTPADELA